jgi:3-methyladenine DNA glycosylase AlkD
MNQLMDAQKRLHQFATTPEKSSRYFKTGPGDYAEHDCFIGVSMGNLRAVAKEFSLLSFDELQKLLFSKINEERALALIILVGRFKRADEFEKKKIYDFYLKNLSCVNNWNLVDVSAHLIVGAYLLRKDKDILFDLVKSKDLWERRVAMVSTWFFIRHTELRVTFELAEILLNDTHDLMHKAAGWMLREAGKKDFDQLVSFLEKHATIMPRTMLRYSIERFPEEQRQYFLKKKK